MKESRPAIPVQPATKLSEDECLASEGMLSQEQKHHEKLLKKKKVWMDAAADALLVLSGWRSEDTLIFQCVCVSARVPPFALVPRDLNCGQSALRHLRVKCKQFFQTLIGLPTTGPLLVKSGQRDRPDGGGGVPEVGGGVLLKARAPAGIGQEGGSSG